MGKIVSSKATWEKFYSHWSQKDYYRLNDSIERFRKASKRIENMISDQLEVDEDIVLEEYKCEISKDKIEQLCYLQNGVMNYANSITEDVDECIEGPLYQNMQRFTSSVFRLRPNEIIYRDNKSGTSGKYILLQEALGQTKMLDIRLKRNFDKQAKELGKDDITTTISIEFKDEMWKWKKSFPFQDIKEIDRIISKGNNANILSQMMPYFLVRESKGRGSYYNNIENYASIENLGKEWCNIKNPYTTLFHEWGHMYDNSILDIKEGNSVSSISNRYISCIEPFRTAFNNALIRDCKNYLSQVAEYNGCDIQAAENIVFKELAKNPSNKPKVAEITDLYGGILNKNHFLGTYGHETSYWKYEDNQYPNINVLNREAFAHFFEIFFLGDKEDIQRLGIYFPSAYALFEKRIET